MGRSQESEQIGQLLKKSMRRGEEFLTNAPTTETYQECYPLIPRDATGSAVAQRLLDSGNWETIRTIRPTYDIYGNERFGSEAVVGVRKGSLRSKLTRVRIALRLP